MSQLSKPVVIEEQPVMKAPRVRYHVLDTGYCMALESLIMRGAPHRKIRCHSLVGLLRHPEQGWILWDTGYAPRIIEATKHLPYSLYRVATPLHIRPELAVVRQLGQFGISAQDITRVILSHFHADHIAGLRDFPNAEIVTTRKAYEGVAKRKGLNALRRGFIPSLLPPDFKARATLLQDFSGPSLPGLGATYDLFNDGSLLLVELPGHARGQIGMLANTKKGQVLFAADGCWLTRQVRKRRPPHPITSIFVDDFQQANATIDNLHTFMQARPNVTILPTHCPEAYHREVEHVL